MELIIYKTPQEFLEAALPFLTENESKYNLIIGIASSYRVDNMFLAAVFAEERLVLASLMTPPHLLIITEGPKKALDLLNDYLSRNHISFPGIVGGVDESGYLTEISGNKIKKITGQMIYECREVINAGDAAGKMRTAELSDVKLLENWMQGFHRDAHLPKSDSGLMKNIKNRIDKKQLVIWEDGQPVSMAGSTGKTPSGIRIGAVYTPAELRGKGYATANVAALTQMLLDQGNKYCFLYTDSSNPISNGVYHKIGYRHIADSQMIEFSN